jgi:hypothetical protein
MKAPKKTYLSDFTDTTEAVFYVKKDNTNKTDIEYTRTDTLIERACEFLSKTIWNITYEDLEGNSVENNDKIKFIETFKNYMKG